VSSADLTGTMPGAGVLFTDRAAGNMSSVGGRGHELGAANRERLRVRLGLTRMARGYQVHGTVVQVVRRMPDREPETGELQDADGQATPIAGLGAMVLAADCLPVAIAAPEGAVAMVHAGWRGLAAGVLEEGVRAVRELCGGSPRLQALLGPSAGSCCYEVGREVHAALATGIEEKAPVDLRTIARARLHAAGVVTVGALGGCTICDERFFSHRREGEASGRQAGVAWLS
jgi:YfiH family protein